MQYMGGLSLIKPKKAFLDGWQRSCSVNGCAFGAYGAVSAWSKIELFVGRGISFRVVRRDWKNRADLPLCSPLGKSCFQCHEAVRGGLFAITGTPGRGGADSVLIMVEFECSHSRERRRHS